MALVGNKVFADDQVKMRSLRRAQKQCDLIKRRHLDTKTEMLGERCIKIGVLPSQARDALQTTRS